MSAASQAQDARFRAAAALIDAGDRTGLERLLAEDRELASERLTDPGAWLTGATGDAVEGFFRRPYLLWFVAEDPVRNGRLPANIAAIAGTIVDAAQRSDAGRTNLQEQLDYALRLVSWSWIARQCGVQVDLIDALLDAGAALDGDDLYEGRYGTHSDAAIYNGNFAAAAHLLARGARPTLTTRLCLGHWVDAERLAMAATHEEKLNAFVQAALGGNAEALRRMLALGVEPTAVSRRNQSHATALHHAVWSGSLEAVAVLVEAGADSARRDTIYGGTPLDWAEYAATRQADPSQAQRYRDIAAYLIADGSTEPRRT